MNSLDLDMYKFYTYSRGLYIPSYENIPTTNHVLVACVFESP